MRTADGRDLNARVLSDPGSNGTGSYAPACYLALSPDTAAPDPSHHSLPSEIVSGTLVRALGAYAHTTGTNVYTVTKTFTSDQSVTVAKLGLYNAAGVLAFETLLNAPAVLKVGDQVSITEVVTL